MLNFVGDILVDWCDVGLWKLGDFTQPIQSFFLHVDGTEVWIIGTDIFKYSFFNSVYQWNFENRNLVSIGIL